MSGANASVGFPFRLARRERRRSVSVAAFATMALLGVFLSAEVVIVLRNLTGPFLDESIYISAGQRTLQGHGVSDFYLTWFSGSLLWPVMAAIANSIGGLDGARILSAILVTVALAGSGRATVNLFGTKVAPWAILIGAINGSVFALGHLAVYDSLALAFLGLSYAAVTEFDRRDDRIWLVAAAVLLIAATLAKYPALVFGGVPIFLVLAALRGRKAPADLAIAMGVGAALLLAFYLPERQQLAQFLSFRVGQNPGFGSTESMILFQLPYFIGASLPLALAGVFLSGKRRRVALMTLTAVILPSAYQLGTHTSVGIEKHCAYAVLIMLPVAGLTLERAWGAGFAGKAAVIASCAGLAAFGALQTSRIDSGWVDVRPSVAFLEARVEPGQTLLIDNSWPYRQSLYEQSRINSPFDVSDPYTIAHQSQTKSLCSFDWFVVSPGGQPWSRATRDQIRRCGTFKRVFSQSYQRTSLGTDLAYFDFDSKVNIFRNVGARR